VKASTWSNPGESFHGRDVLGKLAFRGDCSALPTYRLYRLDGAGKIIAADWVEAETDDLAMAEAAKAVLAGNRSYELWDRNRLVARNGRRQP
jgi:hypothetical protein